MKAKGQFFPYQAEPIGKAVLIAGCFLIAAVVFLSPLIRLLLLVCAAGPLYWIIIQLGRRGRGVLITDTHLLIAPMIGPARQIALSSLQDSAIVSTNHVAVAYLDTRQSATTSPDHKDLSRLALTDARPSDLGPKRRLVVSRPVADIAQLDQAIQKCLVADRAVKPLPAGFVESWAERRRTRNTILVILAVMATPIYAMILFRFFAAFIYTGAANFVR
jgi:hypothetical protein